MSLHLDYQRLYLGRATQYSHRTRLHDNSLTGARQLREGTAAPAAVRPVRVGLAHYPLTRLVHALQHRLLLLRQRKRHVLDEPRKLLVNSRARVLVQILRKE